MPKLRSRRTTRDWNRALKLLQDASSEIREELYAAGPDEVAQHPTLKRKSKLADQIDAWLAKQMTAS